MIGIPSRAAVISALTIVSLLAAVCGPVGAQQQQQQQQQQKSEDAIDPTAKPMAPPGLDTTAAPPVDPKSFKIGAEDVINIRVWKEPELSGDVVVRPDGRISVSLIGELDVAGKTPEELRLILTEEYGKVLNDPVITVRMASIRSSKYYVTGSVTKTGMYPLVVPTTVLEAITLAGGFTEFANKKKVVILRKGKQHYFNYNDVIKGKKIEQNLALENGDFIVVN
jgi:polysaccharide biosynthesis/export protein